MATYENSLLFVKVQLKLCCFTNIIMLCYSNEELCYLYHRVNALFSHIKVLNENLAELKRYYNVYKVIHTTVG